MPEIDFLQGTNELMGASWGKIRLFASSASTDAGRTQVVHELSSGDDHPVQDRGLRTNRTKLKLQFDDFPGSPPPLEAALILEAAKNSGARAIFTHPMFGRYLASVGDFAWEVDEHSNISADVEFIKESEIQAAVTPAGAASSGTSGEGAVAQAAEAMDGQLASVGMLKMAGPTLARLLPAAADPDLDLDLSFSANLSIETSVDLSVSASVALAANASANASANATASADASASATATAVASASASASATATASADASISLSAAASAEASAGLFAAVTIDARVAVASWSTGSVPTRQIVIDASRISNNIATMIEVGRFEHDLDLWPAFRAAIMLGESVRSAAISATSETPAVFVMRVLSSTALLPLAARIYGGFDATTRARQIASLNDISTPGWLAPGDYLMPARTPAQQSPF